MKSQNKQKKTYHFAPGNLLKRAEFLNRLGVPRAALVLYDWAIALAPEDPLATEGQAEARRRAIEVDTDHYWMQIGDKRRIRK